MTFVLSVPVYFATMATPEALKELFDAMGTSRDVSYFMLAAVVIPIYDILLNLSREIQHVWHAKLSLVKLLYFIARYYGLAFLIFIVTAATLRSPSEKFCVAATWVTSLAGPAVFTTTINIILTLRLHALYEQKRSVFIGLSVLVFAEFVLEVYSCIKAGLETKSLSPPLGLPWTGCLYIPPPSARETLLAWISCLTVALIFFLMMVYKFAMMVKFRGRDARAFSSSTSLLTIFVRDGTFYFFLIFVMVLLCTTFINVTSLKARYQIPFAYMIAVYSIAGSNLILNLRSAAHGRGTILSFTANNTDVSELRVARRYNSNTFNTATTTAEFEMESLDRGEDG